MDNDELTAKVSLIQEEANAGRLDAAWASVQPLLRMQSTQESVAMALISIVESRVLPFDKGLTILEGVYSAHHGSETVLAFVGQSLQGARDIDMLNAAPPESPLFLQVVNALIARAKKAKDTDAETNLLAGLAIAARLMARQQDAIAESAYRRLIELHPNSAADQYNWGLFLKTRGRFHEGMLANQNAERFAEAWPEAYEWNLGICATGAGEGLVALEVWKRLEQNIELGRFGLPEGRYPLCKVRLAQAPLAERTAEEDDPGLEETVWIERLSPCHGIIRSVLFRKLGIDYGDAVLFDGAPITYHTYDDVRVPVFPHLATLRRNHYQLFDFAGTQEASGQIASISDDLDREAVVYSHSESFVVLCANCWRSPDVNHQEHNKVEKHVVVGRIAAPADFDPQELIRQIDAAAAQREGCRIYAPDLCEAAGLSDRADFERRRFAMICENV